MIFVTLYDINGFLKTLNFLNILKDITKNKPFILFVYPKSACKIRLIIYSY